MKRDPVFKPLWFMRGLEKPGVTPGAVPELALPRGDAAWTIPDSNGGRKTVRWRDGWQSCWRALLNEFLPLVQTRAFITADELRKYEPQSGLSWWREIDDSELPKVDQNNFTRHGVGHAQYLNDVCGWALDRTLEYCRFRMQWGDWSVKDAQVVDRPDAFFFVRPQSQRACKFLMRIFIDFANARIRYHRRVEKAIKRPIHSQARSSKPAGDIVRSSFGRPKKVRTTSDERGDEDLWLTLIWPVAMRHGWSYRDIARALRLHFRIDESRKPAPEITLKRNRKAVQAHFDALANGEIPFNQGEQKWREVALVVRREDAEAMRIRCARLGLEKLSPKEQRQGIRRSIALPHSYRFADSFRRI
jgi:hypothetical protein